MTLIELLFAYALMVEDSGRKAANSWLKGCGVNPVIAKEIIDTVTDDGLFTVYDEDINIKNVHPYDIVNWIKGTSRQVYDRASLGLGLGSLKE